MWTWYDCFPDPNQFASWAYQFNHFVPLLEADKIPEAKSALQLFTEARQEHYRVMQVRGHLQNKVINIDLSQSKPSKAKAKKNRHFKAQKCVQRVAQEPPEVQIPHEEDQEGDSGDVDDLLLGVRGQSLFQEDVGAGEGPREAATDEDMFDARESAHDAFEVSGEDSIESGNEDQGHIDVAQETRGAHDAGATSKPVGDPFAAAHETGGIFGGSHCTEADAAAKPGVKPKDNIQQDYDSEDDFVNEGLKRKKTQGQQKAAVGGLDAVLAQDSDDEELEDEEEKVTIPQQRHPNHYPLPDNKMIKVHELLYWLSTTGVILA